MHGDISPELGRLAEALEGLVASRAFLSSAELFVSLQGDCVANATFGHTGESVVVRQLYCCIKSVLALGAAIGCAEGRLDTEAEVGASIADASPYVKSLTLRELLSHSAGLFRFSRRAAHLLEPEAALAFALAMEGPSGFVAGQHLAYSEEASWLIAAEMMSSSLGDTRSYLDDLLRRIATPHLWLGGNASDAGALEQVLSPGYDYRFDPPRRDSSGSSRRALRRFDPGTNGFGSARSLGHLFEATLGVRPIRDVSRVTQAAASDTLFSPATPVTYDPVMRRTCSYSLGFMCDLANHEFGSFVPPDSVGQVGPSPLTFAVADRTNDLVVAVVTDAVSDELDAVEARRAYLLGLVYEGLALRRS